MSINSLMIECHLMFGASAIVFRSILAETGASIPRRLHCESRLLRSDGFVGQVIYWRDGRRRSSVHCQCSLEDREFGRAEFNRYRSKHECLPIVGRPRLTSRSIGQRSLAIVELRRWVGNGASLSSRESRDSVDRQRPGAARGRTMNLHVQVSEVLRKGDVYGDCRGDGTR